MKREMTVKESGLLRIDFAKENLTYGLFSLGA